MKHPKCKETVTTISKIGHGLTVSHETVPLFQMKQWDHFLSGDDNRFVSTEAVNF